MLSPSSVETTPVGSRRPSLGGEVKGAREFIAEVIAKARVKDENAFFHYPVPEATPGYYSTIKTPMDLSTMEMKNAQGAYKRVSEFREDFKTMIYNCREYNEKESFIVAEANRVWKSIQRMIERYHAKLKKRDKTGENFVPSDKPMAPRPKKPRRSAPAAMVSPAVTNLQQAMASGHLGFTFESQQPAGRGRPPKTGRAKRALTHSKSTFSEADFPYVADSYVQNGVIGWINSLDELAYRRLLVDSPLTGRDKILEAHVPQQEPSFAGLTYGLAKALEMERGKICMDGSLLPILQTEHFDSEGTPRCSFVPNRSQALCFTEGTIFQSLTLKKLGTLDGYAALLPRSRINHEYELTLSDEVLSLIPELSQFGIDVSFMQEYVRKGMGK